MNLLEIRTEVRRVLREVSTTASFYSETDLNSWINEGLKIACVKGFALQYTKTLSVTNTVASYVLPWDFIKMNNISNHNGVSLVLISPPLLGSVFIKTGYPIYYYLTQTALSAATRANLTVYTINTILMPATLNGYMYEVTTAGTSGAAPPVYPTTVGGTVTDGSVVLTCRELLTRNYTVTLYDTPTTAGAGVGTYTYIYNAIDSGLYVDTSSPNIEGNLHHYLVDYVCYRALLAARQKQDMMSFLISFCAGFNIEVKGMEGGGGEA